MTYLGNRPNLVARSDYSFTATEGQTVFSGVSNDGRILSIDPYNYDIFINGILILQSDIVFATPSTVTLIDGRNANDNVVIRSYGSTAITKSVSDLQASVGRRVGEIVTMFGSDTTPPPGCLLMNGAAVTSTYPELRAHLITIGRPLNGNGDPLLPDMGGYFMRGWTPGQTVDSGRVFGSTQQDAFQGHRFVVSNVSTTTGIVQAGSNDPNSYGSGSRSTGDPVTDGVNGTPRTASETRPVNITVTYWIKAYNAPVDIATINLSNLTNDVVNLQTTKGLKRNAVTTLSGTFIDWPNLPPAINRLTVIIPTLTLSANQIPILQLGISTGIVTTGYTGVITNLGVSSMSSAVMNTLGLNFISGTSVSTYASVTVVINRVAGSAGASTWMMTVDGTYQSSGNSRGNAQVTLPGELASLRLTTVSGTPTMTGSANVMWEF
ncbi:tail collar domain-containing protein [Rhizobium phage RHph_Y65]|uniref:Tail collar domain-containing protein n=1 Tax=Rhizobium phage RHph_Y65 TaxID=2509785 RepID=A0A7S5RCC2_9CAUD|nr:tail collar domain-containing protein [Rhizobium phage RHph_Y65]QIG72886.1 tail collar domain-containing protein [Rhizobium phage RHph_Y65]